MGHASKPLLFLLLLLCASLLISEEKDPYTQEDLAPDALEEELQPLSSQESDMAVPPQQAPTQNVPSQQVSPSSPQILPQQQTMTQQLPDMPTVAAQKRMLNIEKMTQNELAQAGEYMNEDSAKLNEYFKNRLELMGQSYVQQQVRNQVSGFLQKIGKVKFEFSLDSAWQVSDYELDYLLPIFESWGTQIFTQAGARKWRGRHMLNMGLGMRFFEQNYVYGLNVFYDKDLTLGHERASVGFEAATNDFRFSANYYVPVSGWIDQKVSVPSLDLQAQAATGFDVSLTGVVPFYRPLSLTVEYFQWQGKMVDFVGDFHKNASKFPAKKLSDGVNGVSFSMDWKPIPLIGTSITYTQDEEFSDLTGEIELTWSFDKTLEQQISPINEESQRMLSGMRSAFVKRQNKIILDYQQKKLAKPISLPSVFSVTEGSQASIKPQFFLSEKPVSFLWSGTGEGLLDSIKVQEPVFNAQGLKWTTLSPKIYTLQLTVEDAVGGFYRSDPMKIKISYDQLKSATLNLYATATKSKVVNFIDCLQGDATPCKIFWSLISRRSRGTDILADSFLWHNPQNILQGGNKTGLPENPLINMQKSAGYYQVKLTVDTAEEGVHDFDVPVRIRQAESSILTWDDPDAQKGMVTKVLDNDPSKNKFCIKALHANASQPVVYALTPSRASKDVAYVNTENGEVIIHKAGNARIMASIAASDAPDYSPIAYDLIVDNKSKVELFYWNFGAYLHDESNNIKRRYKPNDVFSIIAISELAADKISYNILPGNTSIASLDPSTPGTVQVHDVGIFSVIAIRDSDQAALSYKMTIEKAPTDLQWNLASVNTTQIWIKDFYPGLILQNTAFSNGGTGLITYHIPKEQRSIAGVSSNGDVSFFQPGSVQVTAIQAEDSLYENTTISYLAIAGSFDNSGLAWNSTRLQSGKVEVVYKENELVDISAASMSPGAINYRIEIDEMAMDGVSELVAQDKGLLRILSPGKATVFATQEAIANYKKQEISYELNVTKGQLVNLKWDPEQVGVDNQLIAVMAPGEVRKISVIAMKGAGAITYAIENQTLPSVATVNKESGEVIAINPGKFEMVATQESDDFYKSNQIISIGTVGTLQSNQLEWDDHGLLDSNDMLVTIPSAPSFTITARSLSNPSSIKYSITPSDVRLATIDESTGTVWLGDQSGEVVVSASQFSYGEYAGGKIDYGLLIWKNPSLHLTKCEFNFNGWRSCIMDGNKIILYTGYPFRLSAQSNSSVATTFDIPDINHQKLITIDSTTGAGKATESGYAQLYVRQSRGAGYAGDQVSLDVTVVPNIESIKLDSAIGAGVGGKVDVEVKLEGDYSNANVGAAEADKAGNAGVMQSLAYDNKDKKYHGKIDVATWGEVYAVPFIDGIAVKDKISQSISTFKVCVLSNEKTSEKMIIKRDELLTNWHDLQYKDVVLANVSKVKFDKDIWSLGTVDAEVKKAVAPKDGSVSLELSNDGSSVCSASARTQSIKCGGSFGSNTFLCKFENGSANINKFIHWLAPEVESECELLSDKAFTFKMIPSCSKTTKGLNTVQILMDVFKVGDSKKSHVLFQAKGNYDGHAKSENFGSTYELGFRCYKKK